MKAECVLHFGTYNFEMHYLLIILNTYLQHIQTH